jgi:hypothetical protein
MSLSIQPDPLEAGQDVSVHGYGFKENTKASATISGPGGQQVLAQSALDTDVYGEISFSLATERSMPAGDYTVTLTSEVDPSLTVQGKFTLTEFNPAQCLTLTPLGGDQVLNVVLMATVQEAFIVQIKIDNICVDHHPPSEWVPIMNGAVDLVRYQIAADGSGMTLWFFPGEHNAGSYPYSAGIIYPGKAPSNMLDFEVTVTDLVYKMDNYYEADYTITYKQGKKADTTDVYQCKRHDEGMGNAYDRYLQINSVTTCSAGSEEHNEQWYDVVDRISGKNVFSTCADCYDSPGPNPGAGGETIQVGGQAVPAYSTVRTIVDSPSEVNTDSTQGYWQWEGTMTIWTDTITGMVVGDSVKEQKYFTGTYDGQQINRGDYGYWYTREYWLDQTSMKLGQETPPPAPPPNPAPPPCTVIIPNVIGMDQQTATATLHQSGYQVIWDNVYTGADNLGLVVDVAPDPNTCADPRNTIVLISINKGVQ